MTPPCPSLTVPVMVPVVICADAIEASPSTHAAARDLASHAVTAMNVASCCLNRGCRGHQRLARDGSLPAFLYASSKNVGSHSWIDFRGMTN